MSRREGREVVFKTLFELDLNSDLDINVAFDAVLDEQGYLNDQDNSYAFSALNGVSANMPSIDELIASVSPNWKINRMATVDRAIIRLAVYEMKFAEEKLTPNIAINEAVELAKKYGSDDSGRFVNGVLSGIIKK